MSTPDTIGRELGKVTGVLRTLGDLDPAVAVVLERQGRRLAPKRTGALASSTTVQANAIVSSKPYALPVHYGWRRGTTVVAGRPWLDEAAEAVEQDALDIYETQILDAMPNN